MLFKLKDIMWAMAIVTTLLLTASNSEAKYSGVTPDSTIDPTVLTIDEPKFLGSKIDPELELIDGEGNEFKFKQLLGKPTVFLFSYYKCDGACPLINRDLKKHLSNITRIKAGEYYNVVTVSFDANDDMMSLMQFEKEIGLPDELKKGWKTTLLKNKEDIDKLAKSIGFNFFWSKSDKTFMHPSVYMTLSPEGRVVRYLYSAIIDEKDLELAIVDANDGKGGLNGITDFTDIFLAACFSYNFKEGKYTINYPIFISGASLFIGVSLIALSLTVYKNKGTKEVKS